MNQGVAASNYKHWMRRAVSEYALPGKKSANTTDFQVGMSYEEYAKLKEARTKVDKMTQKIWYALRKMIVEDGLRQYSCANTLVSIQELIFNHSQIFS